MKKALGILFLVLQQYVAVFAQPDPFLQIDYLQVFKDGKLLSYPWAGGINSGQIGTADLNNDGINDLIVFEKTENRVLTFIGKGGDTYEIQRNYAGFIPPIEGWFISKDYNCDDIEDFFTYRNGSIAVYEGFYENDTLQFIQTYDELLYKGFSGLVNLYSSFVDRPAITDFDKDGDLDILTFNVTANRLLYYENQRVENGLSCDSLKYDLVDYCWGNVYESGLSPYLDLRDTCTDKTPLWNGNFTQRKHAGSTVEAFDIDGNGRMDILMGDVSLYLMNYLKNSGTLQEASVLEQDTAYPRYDVSVNLATFPLPVFADINNDGNQDLIVTAFEGFGVENVENIWYYQNLSSDSARLKLRTKSFLVEDMIKAGEASFPCLIDIDGDGLQDLLIGSGGIRRQGREPVYPVQYYRNIGSADYPVFRLENEDLLNFSGTGLSEPAPSAGDIDNDGDIDLLMGIGDGRVLFYQNTSGNTSFTPASPVFLQSAGSSLDIGQNATPCVVDLDRDGRRDLVLGERNGNINYFRNVSGANTINLQLVTDSVGKIKTSTSLVSFGNSAPKVLDLNNDSKLDLVVGGFENILFFVSNIQDSILSRTTPIPLLNTNVRTGRRLAPVLADITADGKPEMLLGVQSGGIYFFSQNPPPLKPVSVKENLSKALQLNVFPNPGNGSFNVILPQFETTSNYFYSFLDVSGRILSQGRIVLPNSKLNFDAPNGIYFLQIQSENSIGVAKIIIQQAD